MSLHDRSVVEKTGSHVCSAQSESVSSLQFDKQIKFRSYSSQFTINDQILVAVERREIQKPIEDIVSVEVDLSVGIIDELELSRSSKYRKVCHLDEMARNDTWLNKMITYDAFNDKTVIKSIRDEAMEPNKLYLLKHKHKHETTERLTDSFGDNKEPERKTMRTTAAQFNPKDVRRVQSVDRLVYPMDTSNSLDIFLKSKNVLRNELIIHTGDITKRSIDSPNKTQSPLPGNLITYEISPISYSKFTLNNTDKCEIKAEDKFEEEFQEKEQGNLDTEDFPFAEETDISEHDAVDSSPNKISKTLQYFVPVFGAPLEASTSNETLNFERGSDYSREEVTTDENESVNNTADRLKLPETDDIDSLSAASYDEYVNDFRKKTVPNYIDRGNYTTDSQNEDIPQTPKDRFLLNSSRFLHSWDDWADLDDVRYQEDQVIHINPQKTLRLDFIEDSPKKPKLAPESNYICAPQKFQSIKPSISIAEQNQLRDFYKFIDVGFPTDKLGKTMPDENEDTQIETKTEREYQSTQVPFEDEDDKTFSKTKSFSVRRKSNKIEDNSKGLNDQIVQTPTKNDIPSYSFDSNTNIKDDSSSNSLSSDRREKFFKSDFNSNKTFFKPVTDIPVSPPRSRTSSLSVSENVDTFKKNETSSYSSEGSMIIKDVSSDDAYVFPKAQSYFAYEVLDEESENEYVNIVRNKRNTETSSNEVSIDVSERQYAHSATSDDISYLSSMAQETEHVLFLTDLVKTPIETTPGKFEKFLKDRELRMSMEKAKTDESSSYNEEESLYSMEKIIDNGVSSKQMENKEESSYTADTSSSSSDYPPIVNPVLRQGESIEDIEKFLMNRKQDMGNLKRSSGYDCQLNEVYQQENGEKNLLYSNQRNSFSTSSDDNTSLRVPAKPTISVIKEKNYRKVPLKESETADSNSSTPTSDKNIRKFFEKKQSQLPNEMKKKPLVSNARKESVSSSQSESTVSISTTSEEPQSLIEKNISVFNDREEDFLNKKSLQKQISAPIPKKRLSLSSSRESNKDSLSSGKPETTETSERKSGPPQYKDREEKFTGAQDPKDFVQPSQTDKKELNSLSDSESSRSISTSSSSSSSEIIQETKNLNIPKETLYKADSVNKEKSSGLRNEELSDDEDHTKSLSTSTENMDPQNASKIPPSKFVERQEKSLNTQPMVKHRPPPKSTENKSKSSSSSSSTFSLSTSSDDFIKLPKNQIPNKTEPNQKQTSANVSSLKDKGPYVPKEKDKKNLSIDRREKFTKLGKNYIKQDMKRSESVPNYFEDPDNVSDLSSDDHQVIHSTKFSQSLKDVNAYEVDDPSRKNRSQGYELVSAVLKDDDQKKLSLSIDRREKLIKGKSVGKTTSLENKRSLANEPSNDKDEQMIEEKISKKLVPSKNVPFGKFDLSGSSTSISTSSSMLSEDEHEEKRGLSQPIKSEIIKTSVPSEIGNKKQIDKEENSPISSGNETSSYTTSSEDERVNLDKPHRSIDRLERFTNISDSKDKIVSSKQKALTKGSDSDQSNSDSESISTTSSSKSESQDKQKNPSKFTDRQEDFNKKDIPSFKKIHREASSDSLKESSKPDNKDTKEIERIEKFMREQAGNSIQKKKGKEAQGAFKEDDDSSTYSITSAESSLLKTSEKGKEKGDKDLPHKISDSTDEDISLTFSSEHIEVQETPIIVNEKENRSITPEEAIFEPKIKRKYKIKASSDSWGSASDDEQNDKKKYEKNKSIPVRDCSTMPINKAKSAQHIEKSKSLDKGLAYNRPPLLSHSTPGSMGDIIESNYHEFTETWSRQSPIDRNLLKENSVKPKLQKQPSAPTNHINGNGNKKWKLPLTTRPRPVPSYLSPINAFPYVPTDQEFESADSLISDYSKDFNDTEEMPVFKSLPEFVKSLETKSLPKQHIVPKKVVKKQIPKKKTQADYINLNYGMTDNKQNPQKFENKKKTSLTSVTTDSSYLEKPILREIPSNNIASSDSMSSLTYQSASPQKVILPNRLKQKAINQNSQLNNRHISSTSSSDTQTPLNEIPKNVPAKFQNIDRQAFVKKSSSLPAKRIPSSSESSDFSSTSDESSTSIHHF